jgi:tRNA modification GTPase
LARQLPADTVELRIGDQGRQGRQELEQAVAQELSRLAGQREARTQHSERHQVALQEALVAVGRAQEWVEASGPQDLVAEELRVALLALAALMGETTPEDLLDRLFSSFCIGK